ncbi:M4 family metallopeptidase [Bacillus spongiae]|uniref:Neutral metalloproteinase n=1 Tax=Bacillus spongiae TaxID=2683610 RepID=A0ABU8HDT4_9BACI
MKKRKMKKVATALTLSTTLFAAGGMASANESGNWSLSPEMGAELKSSISASNTPAFVKGNFSSEKIKSEKDVEKFFQANKGTFGINPKKELIFIEKETDELGMTHYTFQPAIQNIPIDQSQIILHVDENDNLVSINGEFHANSPSKVKQSKKLTKSQALNKAWKHIDVDRKQADRKIATPKGETSFLSEDQQLVVLEENGEYSLAYHVTMQFSEPYIANWNVWVNAENGEVLKAVNEVHDVASTGTGTGVLGDTKSLNTYFYNNTYYLFDVTKPMAGVIQTFDNNYRTFGLPGSYMTDSGNTFFSDRQKAGVDAHYYAGEVFDYFYETFGRESYDDRGADITSTVHYGSNYNNAGWNGNQMIYGDGDGFTFTALSGSKDVVAHELTHAVTDYEADLVYEFQPGALNESFSDVFGYFVDSENWLLGEDVYTPTIPGDALRSLSNPTLYDQPDHMNDFEVLPNTRAGDWGGVHINSGIPNKAAYHTINAIGKSKAENIYYRALTVYLTPNSQFTDARQALIQSAQDLYGSSEANSVASAWDSVGVF